MTFRLPRRRTRYLYRGTASGISSSTRRLIGFGREQAAEKEEEPRRLIGFRKHPVYDGPERRKRCRSCGMPAHPLDLTSDSTGVVVE